MSVFVFLPTRPPRSRMCRTRRLCQGQALTSRSAALDIRRLASGCTFLRATDVNASGGSSVNEHHINTKGTKSRKAFFLSGIFTLPSSFSPAYPQFCISVCHPSASVIALHAFPYARRIHTPRTPAAFPVHASCVPVSRRMCACPVPDTRPACSPCRPHAYLAPRKMPRRLSFSVRDCQPTERVHVRAGEWLRPLDPPKPKGQRHESESRPR